MTRHHTEPKVNILLTRNLSFDCDVRQWTHRLMTLLHCLWGKSNNTTCGQFECDVLGTAFALISFVHMHGAAVVPEFVYVFKLRKKKWKSKTRVTSSNPRVKSSNSRVTSSNPRVRRLKARVARLKARVARLKARVGKLKVRVGRLKARVRNHCLANAELTPDTKVLKNLVHNVALKKHI